jgi:CSLREA domain-containing protein
MASTSNTNLWLAAGLTAVLVALASGEARAAVFVTTKTEDTADAACDRDCSLREAVIAANLAPGQDVIILAPGLYHLTRTADGADDPAAGDLDFTGNTVLYGQSAATTAIFGDGKVRILDVPAGVALEVVGVSLLNGRSAEGGGAVRNQGALFLTRSIVSASTAVGAGAPGGGIWSFGGESALAISESTISDNTAAGAGGGIAVGEAMVMVNSTVSGNNAGDVGGGIFAFKDTDAAITESTIAGNGALKGGGIYGVSDPFASVRRPHVGGSIVAGNSGENDHRDCSGSVVSDGGNVLGDGGFCIDFSPAKHDLEGTGVAPLDAKLGPLANNGGTTPTRALLAGSPAIDKLATCESVDQRGQTRPSPGCDIGAFELGNDCLDGGPTLCLNQDRFRVTAQFRTAQASGDGQAVPFTTDSGLFWFFDPANIELTVKVLDGCGLNGRYWVFLSGLTNVEVKITVTDTANGAEKTYDNPLNRNFRPDFDTGAFASGP